MPCIRVREAPLFLFLFLFHAGHDAPQVSTVTHTIKSWKKVSELKGNTSPHSLSKN